MLPVCTVKLIICLVASEQMQRLESVGSDEFIVFVGQAAALEELMLNTQIKGTMLIWKYPLSCMHPQTPAAFGIAKVGQEVLQSRGDS